MVVFCAVYVQWVVFVVLGGGLVGDFDRGFGGR